MFVGLYFTIVQTLLSVILMIHTSRGEEFILNLFGDNETTTIKLWFPGDIRYQVASYCSSHRLPLQRCQDIHSSVISYFAGKNTPSRFSSCDNNLSSNLNANCRRNRIRIAILHLATQNAPWDATHCQAINLFYARRHGYEFISMSCPTNVQLPHMWDANDQVRANWAKPNLILQILGDYHYVVILDSDAYFSDPSWTIEEFIDQYMHSYSIIVPKNCMGVSSYGYQCWNDEEGIESLNIGAMIVKNDDSARQVLTEWAESIHDDCQQYVFPKWQSKWAANDQRCLSLLYKLHPHFSNSIHVLSPEATRFFIGGAKGAWIKHWMGSSGNAEEIGTNIRNDLLSIVSKRVFDDNIPPTMSVRDRHWVKHSGGPVLGGDDLGTCFDVSVLSSNRGRHPQSTGAALTSDVNVNLHSPRAHNFTMYFSWRPTHSIGMIHSRDGVSWDVSSAEIVLVGKHHAAGGEWETDVNRPFVLFHENIYHMWYTGQVLHHTSQIGYARSTDGVKWHRLDLPVFSPVEPWEKQSIMCSHVIYDEKRSTYRMWYSAGDQHEPLAIGHAISCDGISWNRTSATPIFTAEKRNLWEQERVSCPTVVYNGEFFYMFYIGFRDADHAAIGIARSIDGISAWERHPDNPILEPSVGQWDADAVYKPFPIFNGGKWMLWYNGRSGGVEQIGLATLQGHNLGFPELLRSEPEVVVQPQQTDALYGSLEFATSTDNDRSFDAMAASHTEVSEKAEMAPEVNEEVEVGLKSALAAPLATQSVLLSNANGTTYRAHLNIVADSVSTAEEKIASFCLFHELQLEQCRVLADCIHSQIASSESSHPHTTANSPPLTLFYRHLGTVHTGGLLAGLHTLSSIVSPLLSPAEHTPAGLETKTSADADADTMESLRKLQLLKRQQKLLPFNLVAKWHLLELLLRIGHTRGVESACELGFGVGESTLALLYGSKSSRLYSFEPHIQPYQATAISLLGSLVGKFRVKFLPGDLVPSITRLSFQHSLKRLQPSTRFCDILVVNDVVRFSPASPSLSTSPYESASTDTVDSDGGAEDGAVLDSSSDVTAFHSVSSCDNIVVMAANCMAETVVDGVSGTGPAEPAPVHGSHSRLHADTDIARIASWRQAASADILHSYGCFVFHSNSSSARLGTGGYGFCVGSFVVPDCEAVHDHPTTTTRTHTRIVDILETMRLPVCFSGCCAVK